MPDDAPTAVIYVPAADDLARHAARCFDHCAQRGYQVAGIVTADWPTAFGMLASGAAGILVIARPDHVPTDAQPRIEIAATASATAHRPGPAGDTRTRRPQPL